MSDAAPMLHVVGLWLPGDQGKHVAKSLKSFVGDPPPGFSRGQVVTFGLSQADTATFKRTMRLLDLAELNQRG